MGINHHHHHHHHHHVPERGADVPVLEVAEEADPGASLVQGDHRVLGERHRPVVHRDGLGDDQLGQAAQGAGVEDGEQVLVSQQRGPRG